MYTAIFSCPSYVSKVYEPWITSLLFFSEKASLNETVKKINDSIFLFPPLQTRGLLEVREVGIMTVPYVDNIKLFLIVELVDHEIERLPSKKMGKFMNLNISKIKIYGKNSSSVAKIKLKLNEIKDNA